MFRIFKNDTIIKNILIIFQYDIKKINNKINTNYNIIVRGITMYETVTQEFKTVEEFEKIFNEILPKINGKELEMEINLIKTKGKLNYLDGLLFFYVDNANHPYSFMNVIDIFELKIFLKNTKNKINKCICITNYNEE